MKADICLPEYKSSCLLRLLQNILFDGHEMILINEDGRNKVRIVQSVEGLGHVLATEKSWFEYR